MAKYILIPILFIILTACVGIDYLDDPIIGESILLENEQVAIAKGISFSFSPRYFDQYGIEREVRLEYTSSNPTIATVSENGTVTALDFGTAFIEVAYMEFVGARLQVNVPFSNEDVALVRIASPRLILNNGQSVQLTIEVEDLEGMKIENKPVQWFSENSGIVEIDQNGTITAKSAGKADVHAKVDGVKSNVITISVEDNSRIGNFVPAGGYQAKGTATLERIEGKLILKLGEDFATSFALGTFIYLANSTNGSQVRVNGLEIAQIRVNGPHTFDLSVMFPNLGIQDYDYVIVLCKPASVTFGFAKLSD
jgi:hypothetical protein